MNEFASTTNDQGILQINYGDKDPASEALKRRLEKNKIKLQMNTEPQTVEEVVKSQLNDKI